MAKQKSFKGKRSDKSETGPEYACGIHATMAALERMDQNNLSEIKEIYLQETRQDKKIEEITALAAEKGISVSRQSKDYLDNLVPGVRYQGVIAELLPYKYLSESSHLEQIESSPDKQLILILDQIQDPHNLGACLRTAECAGVDAVVVPRHSSCPVNETVRRVSAGAASRVSVVQVTNLARYIQKIQNLGVWVTGTSDQADRNLFDLDFNDHTALVMGAEGTGIRLRTADLCDQLVSIPMRGQTSSLNVSVATGVVLFEVLRQRLQ